jgi:L-threonylcarbamoyladenylate synthase
VAKIKSLKEKVLEIVKKIKEGKVLSYKEVAEKMGKPKAYRFVANVLMENNDLNVPCHRVVRNDYSVGEYNGLLFVTRGKPLLTSEQLKLAILLKEGVPAVIPTDTIYGICASGLNKKAVEKVYKLRRRNPKKPCIILISKIEDLKLFRIKLTKKQKEILKKFWPGKVSMILDIKDKQKIKELNYLHRGTNSLAFRLPRQPKWLLKFLEISGPLIAPSANWEGYEPAKTINEARNYFGKNAVYYDGGKIIGKPSTLIKLNKKIEILRKGSDYNKVLKILYKAKSI